MPIAPVRIYPRGAGAPRLATTSIRRLTALICALAALVLPVTASAATPNDPVIDLRVLTPAKTLTDGVSFVTGSTKIKTSPKATCFIDGSGGSGAVAQLPGATAFGSVIDAASWNMDLKPIRVTDEFGFGLGVCAIGGSSGNADRYWSLTINHLDPGIGGDQAAVQSGDSVLWYLTGFPPPPELEILAPVGTGVGELEVTVVAHSCVTDFLPPYATTCSTDPVEGATVAGAGAAAETAADGTVTLTASAPGRLILGATHVGDIPAAPVRVCVAINPGNCPADRGRTIVGRAVRDVFAGTAGPDRLLGRAGNDLIRAVDGGRDKIDCGGGRDRVVLARGDHDDRLFRCERVIRR